MIFFKSKDKFLAFFLSIALLIFFLAVPAQDTEVKRAKAKAQIKPVTLQSIQGIFNESTNTYFQENINLSDDFCINVPVLMYHHIEPIDEAKKNGHDQLTVSPQMFEAHINYLQENGYKIISVEDVIKALILKFDPGRAAVITIDDGYKDNYIYAFPISQKYNIPITFFISPGLLESPGYMSWTDLIRANKSPIVSIYNHTWSHFSLPAGNSAEQREEIVNAGKILQEKISKKQNIFAYPYGVYDSRSIEILQNENYIAAFTTEVSQTLCLSKIMTLPRIRIGEAPLSYFGL